MALDKLVDSGQLNDNLTAIANAIRSKGGTNASLAFPNGFVSAIEDIQTDGGSSGADVVFYDDLANDCSGGIIASYSASDFVNLTAMPANPDHSNFTTHGINIPMTSQGWNYSLADAKAYVAKYGKLNIGQTYIPTDGKSHWICYVPENAPVERWDTEIHISVTGGSVNWQIDDGSISTASGNISVTFPSVGWHDVKISAPNGVTYYPYYNSTSKTAIIVGKIQKINHVFIGSNVIEIKNNAFRQCYNLSSITLPDSVTKLNENAFYSCYSLRSITIPNNQDDIEIGVFYNCYALTSIILAEGPINIRTNAFYGCRSLKSITIPESVLNIAQGAFYYCSTLSFITISDKTDIAGSVFYGCLSMSSVTIRSFNINKTIGDSLFYQCYSLKSVAFPDDTTIINNYAFYYCYCLDSITIPDSVTKIGNCAFQYCHSLTSITIPDSVTSVGSYAFSNCNSLKNIIMESQTAPTLINSNAFSNLMSDYSIIVPAGSLSAYTSESNWSALADHIVEASS